MRRRKLLVLALATSVLLALIGMGEAAADRPEPTVTPEGPASAATPVPTFDLTRLAEPQISDPPSQIEEGWMIYWGVCMACHGDQGQGMTEEWRTAFGEDANCWQSQCHGSHHPPQGFQIPRDLYFPSLSNPGALARFVTARDMHDFILEKMPWWNPGSLSDDESWQLTAYILDMKGVLPEGAVLTAANASGVPVRQLARGLDDHVAESVLAGAVLLACVGLVLQTARARPDRLLQANMTNGAKSNRTGRANFFAHLHPPMIPAAQARWRYTLAAGGLGVLLCLILIVTGILEMFYYAPTPEAAALSVQTITFLVPFGGFVRNLHYWAAQALVVVALIHLLRVMWTGAAGARRFNHLLGLGLFVSILLFDFTGYILRWDEGIRWALVAGTNLLKTVPLIGEALFRMATGSDTVGGAALLRFYTWHVYGLALAGGVLLVWHVFRVRRDGGIAAPPNHASPPAEKIHRNELVQREVLAMLLATSLLVLLSAFVPAPIEVPIREDIIQVTEARAPWFFLWVQQLLRLGDPFVWGVLTPMLVLAALALIPYAFPAPAESERGRWFPRGGRTTQILIGLIFLTVIVLTILGYVNANG